MRPGPVAVPIHTRECGFRRSFSGRVSHATRSHAVQWWYSQVPCAGRAGLGAARVRRACGLCASVSTAAARVVTLRVSDAWARAAARLVRSHGLSQAGLPLGSAWARGRVGRRRFPIIAPPPGGGAALARIRKKFTTETTRAGGRRGRRGGSPGRQNGRAGSRATTLRSIAYRN